MLFLLGIFFLFTFSFYKKNMLEDVAKDQENMCSSVANSVQTQLDNISTISLNIVYSNAIKKNFKEFSQLYEPSGLDPQTMVSSREKAMYIHDVVTAMIGAYQTAAEINLFTMDGSCVEAGYRLRTTSVDLESLPWYDETLKLNGHKYISIPTYQSDLPASGDNQRSKMFISLSRLFLDVDGQPEGILEVVQDCANIFALASQLEGQNPDSNVYIYNSRSELVYPYNKKVNMNYFGLISANSLADGASNMISSASGEDTLFTYELVPGYDWTVIVTKPHSAVYKSLNSFRTLFTMIGCFSIFLTLLICFYISKRLTIPLEKLSNATSKITISRVLDDKKVNLTSADSNIKELGQLCDSIRNMYETLRSNSQEILLSHSEETRAKLQATQSLINPHFLYNCLTNMSIMAEEEMNDDIVQMCLALCDYFRYISSSKEMVVPLEEEAFYTKRYLECMQMRFNDEFEYTITLPDNAKSCYIPKLILQPIVENAFKYAFNSAPPWKLDITASLTDQHWLIEIKDNGGYLSDKTKAALLDTYKNLDLNEELKSLEIGGMGLKNVYLRLKLLYGNKAIFKIENSLPLRTIFIVGGPIYLSREDYYAKHPKL